MEELAWLLTEKTPWLILVSRADKAIVSDGMPAGAAFD
jgi:hypothetical protein